MKQEQQSLKVSKQSSAQMPSPQRMLSSRNDLNLQELQSKFLSS